MTEQLSCPWLRMWLSPRKALRSVLDRSPSTALHWLYIVSGYPFAFLLLTTCCGELLPTVWQQWAAIALLAFPAWAAGVVIVDVTAYILLFVGRLLGGQGSFEAVRAAVAWSNSAGLITIIAWLAILGKGHLLFHKGAFVIGSTLGTLILIAMTIQWIVSTWAWILMINMVAEAHQMSGWKGLGTVLLAVVITLAIIMLVRLPIMYTLNQGGLYVH